MTMLLTSDVQIYPRRANLQLSNCGKLSHLETIRVSAIHIAILDKFLIICVDLRPQIEIQLHSIEGE